MLSLLPPWLLIAPLIGVINASLLFVIVGRRPTSLPVYVALGVAAASLAQALQLLPPGPPPFSIGEVHLVSTSVAAWGIVLGARAIGL